MPHVEITLGAGRSREQLRQMIHRVHEALIETVGARPEHVRIVVSEVARTHWATGDVTLAEMDAVADEPTQPARSAHPHQQDAYASASQEQQS